MNFDSSNLGNKKDLRDSTDFDREKFVSFEEGQAMSEEINAFAFFECSAKSHEEVANILESAARATLNVKHKKHYNTCHDSHHSQHHHSHHHHHHHHQHAIPDKPEHEHENKKNKMNRCNIN